MLKLAAIAGVIAALASGVYSASAHGRIDQQAIGPESGSFNISGFRLTQTFRPQDPVLSGVSLGLQRMGTGDTNVTVNIHQGTSTAPIIASSTAFVPDPAPGQPSDYLSPTILVHFDFSTALTVTLGETYVIEANADSSGQGWTFLGSDAYSGGSGYVSGNQTDWDFVFQTCGSRGGGNLCKSQTVALEKVTKKSGRGDCVDFDNDPVCQP